MIKHLRILAPLLAATALAAVGCGGGSSSTTTSYDGGQAAHSATTTKAKAAKTAAAQAAPVAIKDLSFQPATIKLHVGDTVTFRNDDAIAHTVTATDGTFDSGTLQKGAKFAFTAKKAGKISYVCSFHPGMTGTIDVSN